MALSKKEVIKYLGINIDSKLNFNQHVNEKCKRATTVLNMLKRNLYFAPKSVKNKAYQACVLPILEYAPNCWSPTSSKQNNSLEMVHHNAAKFVSNFYPKKGNYENFSITKILNDLNWDSLEKRRNQSRLTMAFKILNGHVILESSMLPKTKFQQPYRKCNEVKVGFENQLDEPSWSIEVAQKNIFLCHTKTMEQYYLPKAAKCTQC